MRTAGTAVIATIVSLVVCGLALPVRAQKPAGAFRAVAAAAPGGPSGSVWDGVYTVGQARRGAALTDRCMSCHGIDLEGDDAPTLIGPALIARWDGWTLGDLFERVTINVGSTFREIPAPDRDSVVAQRSADVLAYLLLKNNFPPGQTEIPVDAAILRQIRFQTARR